MRLETISKNIAQLILLRVAGDIRWKKMLSGGRSPLPQGDAYDDLTP
jgi:hypothetical protein